MKKIKRDKRIIQALQDLGMQEIEIYPMFVPTSGDFASNYFKRVNDIAQREIDLLAAHSSWKSQQAAIAALAEIDKANDEH
jgi:hypothetical protein